VNASSADIVGGADRHARETSRFIRTVSPQVEQMPILIQGMCVGGIKEYPADGRDGSVGYWCYDEEGRYIYISPSLSLSLSLSLCVNMFQYVSTCVKSD